MFDMQMSMVSILKKLEIRYAGWYIMFDAIPDL
jgi:hypothetical protein